MKSIYKILLCVFGFLYIQIISAVPFDVKKVFNAPDEKTALKIIAAASDSELIDWKPIPAELEQLPKEIRSTLIERRNKALITAAKSKTTRELEEDTQYFLQTSAKEASAKQKIVELVRRIKYLGENLQKDIKTKNITVATQDVVTIVNVIVGSLIIDLLKNELLPELKAIFQKAGKIVGTFDKKAEAKIVNHPYIAGLQEITTAVENAYTSDFKNILNTIPATVDQIVNVGKDAESIIDSMQKLKMSLESIKRESQKLSR